MSDKIITGGLGGIGKGITLKAKLYTKELESRLIEGYASGFVEMNGMDEDEAKKEAENEIDEIRKQMGVNSFLIDSDWDLLEAAQESIREHSEIVRILQSQLDTLKAESE